MKRKHFIGVTRTGRFVAFTTIEEPTESNFCNSYIALIGPFSTRKAADWAEKYGRGNPHFQTVNDAEKLCRL